MRKLAVLFLALTLTLGLAGTAWGAYATLEVDSTSWTFLFTPDGYGGYELSQSIQETHGYWSIGISAFIEADPYISYAINAQNNTSSSKNFSFTINADITLPAGPTTVDASIVGGLTDSTGNGVSITPTAAKLQVATVGGVSPTSLGVDVGNSFSDGSGRRGALYAYGPYEVGPQDGPYSPGDWSFMQVTTAFTLSGNNDAAALTGFVELNPVPAPATLLLFLSGLLVLICLGRRRA